MPSQVSKSVAFDIEVHSTNRQTAISLDDNQQPKPPRKNPPTPLPTAPGYPEPSKPHEEKIFNTEEAKELSKIAAAALDALKTSEKKQLKEDLAAARNELEIAKNGIHNLRHQIATHEAASDTAQRALEDVKKRKEAIAGELSKALWRNHDWENQLRDKDEMVEKVRRELARVKEEKAEMEKLLGSK